MASIGSAHVDVGREIGELNCTILVSVGGLRRAAMRLWLGGLVINLGARIMGICRISISHSED